MLLAGIAVAYIALGTAVSYAATWVVTHPITRRERMIDRLL